ncbi:MAG: hypothetical protein GF331_26680 [Chitinivibrionales bacterium]|nr:hypothetical protein [Chitinivibrionales bacterium]
MLKNTMEPAFERALATPGVTAWLLLNDLQATTALAYLREKRIPVPRRLSVMGFDNTAESVAWRLSTMDWNIEALVQRMLEHILSGSDAAAAWRLGRLAGAHQVHQPIPPVAMHRATTAPSRAISTPADNHPGRHAPATVIAHQAHTSGQPPWRCRQPAPVHAEQRPRYTPPLRTRTGRVPTDNGRR